MEQQDKTKKCRSLDKDGNWVWVKSINDITDRLGMPVDEGIKPLVQALLDKEYMTNMSCEGHFSWGRGYPWIDLWKSENDIYKLETLLEQYNKKTEESNKPIKWELRLSYKGQKDHLYELKPVYGETFTLKDVQRTIKPLAEFISPETDVYRYKKGSLKRSLKDLLKGELFEREYNHKNVIPNLKKAYQRLSEIFN